MNVWQKLEAVGILTCAAALVLIVGELAVCLAYARQSHSRPSPLTQHEIERIVQDCLSRRAPREPYGVFGQIMGKMSGALEDSEVQQSIREMFETL